MFLKVVILTLFCAAFDAKYLTFSEAMARLQQPRGAGPVSSKATKRVRGSSRGRARRLGPARPDENPQTVCDLSARIYPLLYRSRTENLEFRMLLQSTCLRDPHLLYFTLRVERPQRLTAGQHPKFVRVNFFNQIFNFKFADGFQRNRSRNVNIAYRYVRVHPANRVVNVNTFEDNVVSLNVNNQARVSRRDLVLGIRNLYVVYCDLTDRNSVMACRVG